MASTNKTPGLLLNKWLGTDKPKRDDFNADNDRIDAAHGALSARLASAEGTLSSHTKNGTIHVTAAERSLWNSGAANSGGGYNGEDRGAVGTYTGNGASTRTITLGYKPRFGFLFAVGQNPVDGNWSSEAFAVYSGFFSESGCSNSIALTSTGFTVNHREGVSPTGAAAVCLNQTGTVYVYAVWR